MACPKIRGNAFLALALSLLLSGGGALSAASQTDPSIRASQSLTRGVSLYYSGKTFEAIKAFEEATAKPSTAVEGHLNAAAVYSELGDHAKACPHLLEAGRAHPTDADVQAALGWAALRSGEFQTAAQAFESALQSQAHPSALLGLGRLQLEKGEPLKASETLKSLTLSNPDFTLAHLYLARAYEALGDHQLAAQAYESANQSDPVSSSIRLSLGRLYAKLRRFMEAGRQYAKVLGADPKNPTAQSEWQKLSKHLAQPAKKMPQPKLSQSLEILHAKDSTSMPFIRVALGTSAQGRPSPKKIVTFWCHGPFEIRDPENGRQLAVGPARQIWTARRSRRGSYELVDARHKRMLLFRNKITVRPLEKNSLSIRGHMGQQAWENDSDYQLKGAVEIRAHGLRGIYLVNILPLEDYLYGVIHGEMPSHFPLEALKAQAIIARTHVLYSKNILRPHRRHGYDVCDGQHCQVYQGLASEASPGRLACDQTRGIVLRYGKNLAQAPYSSNCGGHTQSSSELWGWGNLPYLTGRPDSQHKGSLLSPWELSLWLKKRPEAYCNVPKYMHPSHFRWSGIVSSQELSRWIGGRKLGKLHSIRILRRSPAGNVNRIEFHGSSGRHVVYKEHLIRHILNRGSLRSTLFILETERDINGMPTAFYFYGGGWGHGVGLCQYGAVGRSLAGQTVNDILAHYYPGTYLKNLNY